MLTSPELISLEALQIMLALVHSRLYVYLLGICSRQVKIQSICNTIAAQVSVDVISLIGLFTLVGGLLLGGLPKIVNHFS